MCVVLSAILAFSLTACGNEESQISSVPETVQKKNKNNDLMEAAEEQGETVPESV